MKPPEDLPPAGKAHHGFRRISVISDGQTDVELPHALLGLCGDLFHKRPVIGLLRHRCDRHQEHRHEQERRQRDQMRHAVGGSALLPRPLDLLRRREQEQGKDSDHKELLHPDGERGAGDQGQPRSRRDKDAKQTDPCDPLPRQKGEDRDHREPQKGRVPDKDLVDRLIPV